MRKRIFCGILILMLLSGMTACSQKEEGLGIAQGNGTGFREDDSSSKTEQPAETPTDTTQSEQNQDSGATPPKEEGDAASGNTTPQGGATAQTGGTPGKTPELTKQPVGNPLMLEGKAINTAVMPSYSVDHSSFVKNGIKLANLKGQSLTLLAAHDTGAFFYRDASGTAMSEQAWYEALGREYGLNVKFIPSRYDKQYQQIITYVNANKALELFSTHRRGYPQYFSISASLDPYIDIKKVDQAYGVDARVLEQTKWNNTYRCIAPLGSVDVLWYNETMVQALGLQDPKTLWRQGQWDWNAWKSFVEAVPQTGPSGEKLCPWYLEESDAWYYWALTNGVEPFAVQTTGNKSGLVNAFESTKATEAWKFYASVVKGVRAYSRRSNVGDPQLDLYRNGSAIMSATTHLMRDYSQQNYAKTQKYDWVPYPTGAGTGCEPLIAHSGLGMMLVKKMKNSANAPLAVKLMELWASRFTEAMNDYLQEPYYAFSYEERKEYFEFAMKYSTFPVGLGTLRSIGDEGYAAREQFVQSFSDRGGDPLDSAKKLSYFVGRAIDDAIRSPI